MNLSIEIIDVSVETRPGKTGTYKMFDVTYRDVARGEVKNKKQADFALPPVLVDRLTSAQKGDKMVITLEKKNDYWNWVGLVGENGAATNAPQSGVPTSKAASSNAATTSAKSSYETAEERAQRQRLIVRQSSLTAALSYLNNQSDTKYSVDKLLSLSEMFCNHVFEATTDMPIPQQVQIPSKQGSDMPDDDIPF